MSEQENLLPVQDLRILFNDPIETIAKGAILSHNNAYRYVLARALSKEKIYREETINFLMLNPSTADHQFDDPTIRRCMDFAWRYGYRRMFVTNLFAYRATDPKELLQQIDPIGPRNDKFIIQIAAKSQITVLAYGSKGNILNRHKAIAPLIKSQRIFCLGVTKDGFPRHPLYLPKNSELIPFQWN